jgi:2,5-dihydroxypyridine 5,6-dioxygenase
MRDERIEAKWIDAFARTFRLCEVRPGDVCAILSETQSRPLLVHLAELGLQRCGATAFHVVLPTPELEGPIPVRSTGSSRALRGIRPVTDALAACALVVDCTVEGLLHAPERAAILGGGARIMMISNEHPEVLERLQPDPALGPQVAAAVRMIDAAREMTVTSAAGTDLTIDLRDAPARGSAGLATKPRTISYWPGGLCVCFPRAGSVNGVLVLAPGDANLTFKTYVRDPVRLTIENDHITRIEGDHLDAELLRSYLAAWEEPAAYAVSHVGWGMNRLARWDALTMYDRRDVNGTELRAFAGNFLYSTGANEHADRFTRGHFDFPMRNCTVALDGEPVVVAGQVRWELFDGAAPA